VHLLQADRDGAVNVATIYKRFLKRVSFRHTMQFRYKSGRTPAVQYSGLLEEREALAEAIASLPITLHVTRSQTLEHAIEKVTRFDYASIQVTQKNNMILIEPNNCRIAQFECYRNERALHIEMNREHTIIIYEGRTYCIQKSPLVLSNQPDKH
jgi:hypothetical protein